MFWVTMPESTPSSSSRAKKRWAPVGWTRSSRSRNSRWNRKKKPGFRKKWSMSKIRSGSEIPRVR